MTDTYSQCPKCGHIPPNPLPASASCPKCGIYFFKWIQPASVASSAAPDDEPYETQAEGFLAALMRPMDRMDSASFYGRSIALLALVIWSWSLFTYDYRTGEIGMSFMHNILLPVHEAGHVLFRPFGEFMMVLGGSLFQIALPLAIAVAFIAKQRDNFGGSVGLWWASISLIDLSPYIYDALHPQLTLLGGGTGANDGPHDWIFLLITLGQIDHAQRWGAFAHAVGGLMMGLALVWGAILLWQQHRVMNDNR